LKHNQQDIKGNEQDITNVKLINDIVIMIQKMENSKHCNSDLKHCLYFKDVLKQCLLERDETMFNIRLKALNNVISKQCLL
jgi:hypothetical protein